MLRDNASLLDIYRAGHKVISYAEGTTLEALAVDEMRLSAILYEIVVIGEATTRLSSELRVEHPEISWKSMAGMRNILVHQYDEVDFNLLWDAIRIAIPEMLERIQPLVPEEFSR